MKPLIRLMRGCSSENDNRSYSFRGHGHKREGEVHHPFLIIADHNPAINATNRGIVKRNVPLVDTGAINHSESMEHLLGEIARYLSAHSGPLFQPTYEPVTARLRLWEERNGKS